MADAPSAPAARPLDEVMLAMDVVDTLRHRQKLVARELQAPETDEATIERLRRIYEAQGIDVPDRILREGVEALREDRFAYRPPKDPPLWARLYVRRGALARGALLLAVAALLAWGAYQLAVVAPREGLVTDLQTTHATVTALAADPEAASRADALHERATAALDAGDTAGARADLEDLEALRARLERAYELRIATGPDSAIGVWRVPEINEAARNYYLIVQAVGQDGEPVTLPIVNEETGAVDHVSTFGLGVEETTWNRVAEDLEDDGLIEDPVLGSKRRGALEPEYDVDTTGGAITRW